MNADVSRALARFIAAMNLDREVARELAAQFADVNSVDDLPEWVRETGDADEPSLDQSRAMAEDAPDVAARARELALLGVTRAAGHDVTPGHDELHHYWTRGEGLAKWAESPTPWTTLVAHLTKYVGPEKAKVFASRWFIEVFHFAAGSDMNRVTHGHPPRGHRIGPG